MILVFNICPFQTAGSAATFLKAIYADEPGLRFAKYARSQRAEFGEIKPVVITDLPVPTLGFPPRWRFGKG